MGLFDALDTSASGLTAERLRMDTIANNLANANSVKGADGKPFQRQVVELGARGAQGGGTGGSSFATFGGFQQASAGGGVQALSIQNDKTPGKKVYDPGNPDADRKGYVTMSNVNPVTEMVDLIASSRSYEANVTAMQTAKSMFSKTFDLLR